MSAVGPEGGSQVRDRFFGDGHIRLPGVSSQVLERLFACARSVRNEDVSDKEAVARLVAAAQGHRAVFHAFAEMFAQRDWRGDPLLCHVADLVVAAEAGTPPPPVATEDEETIRLERSLLGLSDAEAFAELARRDPTLVDLQGQAADAEWVASLRDDSGPSVPLGGYDEAVAAGVVPPMKGPFRKWLLRRTVRRGEARFANDPTLQRMVAHGQQYHRVAEALVGRYGQLVGPTAVTDDPLLKTHVAFEMGFWHLLATAGFDFANPPEV